MTSLAAKPITHQLSAISPTSQPTQLTSAQRLHRPRPPLICFVSFLVSVFEIDSRPNSCCPTLTLKLIGVSSRTQHNVFLWSRTLDFMPFCQNVLYHPVHKHPIGDGILSISFPASSLGFLHSVWYFRRLA
jgi:hypothetical protein